jgi:hypothetical protein
VGMVPKPRPLASALLSRPFGAREIAWGWSLNPGRWPRLCYIAPLGLKQRPSGAESPPFGAEYWPVSPRPASTWPYCRLAGSWPLPGRRTAQNAFSLVASMMNARCAIQFGVTVPPERAITEIRTAVPWEPSGPSEPRKFHALPACLTTCARILKNGGLKGRSNRPVVTVPRRAPPARQGRNYPLTRNLG